jgi:NAD(P)H-hydrate epimerase
MVAMKVLSAAEMQACDRASAERFGVPTLELMRAAARAVASFARAEFPAAQRVTVLCGRGNNGGDGLMAARLLAAEGIEVHVILLGPPEGFPSDAAVAWTELLDAAKPGTIHTVESSAQLELLDALFHTDLLIDAVLGTGFKPPMRKLAQSAMERVKASGSPVLAVDLPSGWPADSTAATEEEVFPADVVITFTAPKPAHLFGQLTRCWRQPVVVAPIGSPDEAIVSTQNLGWTADALALVQQPRAAAANKGNFGHVLVVGGSFGTNGGKAGAPAMAALAALRAGAGLVTAAVPAAAMPLVAAVAPELMTWPMETAPHGGMTEANLVPQRLDPLLAHKSVLAVGPGMGQERETASLLAGLLTSTKIPTVIDADALNILAAKPVLLSKLAKSRTLVLTPHPGEMARLSDSTVAKVQTNRLEAARELAARLGAIVVLKGARTVVAHPDGRAAVNTSGNPAMAKGGSGDVLCGLIAGLVAQHPAEPGLAVEAAVYLHGLAADLSLNARSADEHTLLATETLRQLGRAFRTRPTELFRPDGLTGYVCLAGRCTRPGVRRSRGAQSGRAEQSEGHDD